VLGDRLVTPLVVVRRIRALDPDARVVHQVGSHQKWRLGDGSEVMVPIHPGDIPTGTLKSIERQGSKRLGPRWLRRSS
jgi:predicted RNA binding protein YcfA (HicA-like mRNA interferase family)